MSSARFRCGIMLGKMKFAKLCVFHCLVLFCINKWINISSVFLLASDLDIASDLELALCEARYCLLFLVKIIVSGNTVKQQGASEVCLLHYPEVARLKLPPSNNFLAKSFLNTSTELKLLN